MRHREIAGKHGVICQSLNDSEAPKRLVKEVTGIAGAFVRSKWYSGSMLSIERRLRRP
jgi:hypothetical protein